jgi:hypothetical protein
MKIRQISEIYPQNIPDNARNSVKMMKTALGKQENRPENWDFGHLSRSQIMMKYTI